MGNIKNFVGEYAYNIIKNMAFDEEALRKALVTRQNARNVFSELDEFKVKSLCSEISSSGTIGQTRETTQAEIIEAFKKAGYDRVIFDDEGEIAKCKKYYRLGETICTYRNLKGRMNSYYMLVAIKSDIDKIEPAENPVRDDEYGTSILNIQIARDGSHMSIKNRYNHTVAQPDSTLNNNLDMLQLGLQSMVLGYYGFANLKSLKSHYDHIVNIGGVYLKYTVERNNVYYGAFVLDSKNGARFTDCCRYCITEGKEPEKIFPCNTPLILDFQNKVAIDVAQDKRNKNGKTPLLTRALKNGMLSTENKTEVNTLKGVFDNATKELLSSRRKALKYLHDDFGYDFNKPYTVTGFLGNFTAKSLERTTGYNTGILLVYTVDDMRVCKFDNGKFRANDIRSPYGIGISTFYSQGDFEIARKSGTTAMYFIHQDAEYIGNQKRKSSSYRNYSYTTEFDKSGCNLTETRDALARRLKIYKAEQRRKEASQLDYTQDINDIETTFETLKTTIITRLTNAITSDDYNKITNTFNYRFVWLVRDITKIKNNARDNNFASVEEARISIKNVKETIKELSNKLI